MARHAPETFGTGQVVKVAVVREPGHAPGVAAPCFIKCACGARPPAYMGEFVCRCGTRYSSDGWILSRRG